MEDEDPAHVEGTLDDWDCIEEISDDDEEQADAKYYFEPASVADALTPSSLVSITEVTSRGETMKSEIVEWKVGGCFCLAPPTSLPHSLALRPPISKYRCGSLASATSCSVWGDFFIAGTHKWIFGPRGTGVVWGSDKGWSRCKAVIPSFSRSYDVWLGGSTQDQVAMGEHMTPGGFHSFEHRWALPEAFNLHMQLGKAKVQQRIHQLNTLTKQGLQQIKGVTLHTPMAAELSSGLVCFDYKEMAPDDVVKAMHGKGIIISSTPYRQSYARFAPSLVNNEQEIEQTLATLRTV